MVRGRPGIHHRRLILNDRGYAKLAPLLSNRLFPTTERLKGKRNAVHDAVMQKNWAWTNLYKVPNGVHAYGRRYNPYGPGNYPFELQ